MVGFFGNPLSPSEVADMKRMRDTKPKFLQRVIYAIGAFYFLIFLVPDAVWLGMGVSVPDAAYIPNFVLQSMANTTFPVSVFIFFALAPLFFVITLTIMLIDHMSPGGYEFFLYKRKIMKEKRRWNFVLFGIVVMVMTLLFVVWKHPDMLTSPPRTLLLTLLNRHQNKLLFFLVSWVIFVVGVPGAIATLCAEIRARLTKQEIRPDRIQQQAHECGTHLRRM